MRKIAPLSLLLCALPASSLPADGVSAKDIEAKVALESSIEKRVEAVLKKALDTQDLIVIVNVDLVSETHKEKEKDRPEEEVLPGVPVKLTPAAPSAGPLAITLTQVRRVLVTLILDESTPPAEVQLALKTAQSLLSIDPKRGDVLNVEKMRLRRPEVKKPFEPKDLLKPAWIFSALWLLLALSAILVVSRQGFFPLVSLAREWMTQNQASAGKKEREEAVEGVLQEAQPLEAASENALQDADLPFSFIKERDLPMLCLLLQKAKPLSVSAVLHYLPPSMASQALRSLDAGKRIEVVRLMSKVTQLDRSQVQALEESLRSRVNYLMGGEHKLAELIDHAPASLQEELLGALKSHDPELGERLKKRVVLLEDLALLGETELKALFRRVPLRSLAVVLKSDPELKDKLMSKVGHGAGEWLAQEIELTRESPGELVESEQRRVLAALSQLVREGSVVLRRDEAPKAASEAAESEGAG
ncbi:MAG: FliG C-terminal domain-containing protein [Elusimicrobiota bacterium]